MRPHQKSKRRYRRDRLRISNKERRARRPGSGIGCLTRAIFNLFSPMDWKSLPKFENIPLTNRGIIWANLTHDPATVYPYDPGNAVTLEEMGKTLAAADKDYRDRLKSHKPFQGSGDIVLSGSGVDLYRGYDPVGPYPTPIPTIRITDAQTGEQYYPTRILTPKSHNALRMGLVDELGNDLTRVWSIVYYDMGTGEMRYYDRSWTGPDLDHPKTDIFPDLKIIMK